MQSSYFLYSISSSYKKNIEHEQDYSDTESY